MLLTVSPLLYRGTILLAPLVMLGCAFRVASPYDALTDQLTTQLQGDVMRHLEVAERQWGKEGCKYQASSTFYRDAKVSLEVLITRNENRANMTMSVQALATVKQLIDKMEETHMNGCLTPQMVSSYRASFNTSIGVVLRQEDANRRKRLF